MRHPSAFPPVAHLRETNDAESYVGGADVLQELCAHWGLEAFTRTKGFSFYAEEDMNAAIRMRNAQESGPNRDI